MDYNYDPHDNAVDFSRTFGADVQTHYAYLCILRKKNLGHDDDGDDFVVAAAADAVMDSVDLISLNKNYFHLMI